MTMRSQPYVCVPCRVVQRYYGGYPGPCPSCGNELKAQSPKWRAPKKTNDKAWKLIEQGDWLWDRRALRGTTFRPLSEAWRNFALERKRLSNPKYMQNVTDKK